MGNRQDMIAYLLWSGLLVLCLASTLQANTLTKYRVVEAEQGARLILFFSQPPRYTVEPLLEQRRLVIRLADTAAKLAAPSARNTGRLIRAVNISRPQRAANRMLLVDIHLQTSDVVVEPAALDRPPRLLLHLRPGPLAPQAPPSASPSARAPVDPPLPHAPAAQRPAFSPEQPAAEQEAADVALPTAPMRPAAQAAAVAEGGSAVEAAALLDLYLRQPATFAAHPALLWSVAAAYVELGFYEQAHAVYSQLADRTDNPAWHAMARLRRGQVAVLQGEFGAAEQLLRDFIAASPSAVLLAEAYEALGDTLMAQERFRPAAEAYATALSQAPAAPQPPQLSYKLGRACRRAGDWRQAAEAFRQAVDQLHRGAADDHGRSALAAASTFEVDVLQQLGDSLFMIRRYPEAVLAYRQALERAPEAWHSAWARYHLGKSYEALGQDDAAAQLYTELAQQAEGLWAAVGQQALRGLRRRTP
jgi:tetratricopeptide (TPR) repeat protein